MREFPGRRLGKVVSRDRNLFNMFSFCLLTEVDVFGRLSYVIVVLDFKMLLMWKLNLA